MHNGAPLKPFIAKTEKLQQQAIGLRLAVRALADTTRDQSEADRRHS